ncbi:MAG: restriction endonuclease subunit S [Prevotella sp.]|nr:restriction endonuclease subunit S [Prevotella sp.]
MERYSTYKDSGVSWIGEIPEHWALRRVKYIFSELKEKSENGLETPLSLSKDGGIIPFNEKKNRTMESASYVGGKIVHKGEIVFNRFKARLFAVSAYDGIVSSDYAVYECNKTASPEYMVKLFGIDIYRDAFNRKASGIGDGFSRLYTDDLFAMYSIFPPLAEQEKIVSYLENKTSKIDAYVADKEKEIELLQELKQKTIADAVTKGLNPDAKMKDSKTSLFGQIPYHWEERKMKYCFSERSEKNHPEEPILCATQSQGVIPQSMYQNRVVVVNKGFEGLKFVKAGDFVISLRSFEGGIEYAYYQGIISAAYTILTPLNANNTEYFKFLFKSNPFIQVLQTCVTGIREGQNINYQMLGRKFLPLPPSDEQQAIVAYIEEKCEKIDKLASELQSEIDYLKEYKQRLIADCVTGQVNVSGV